MANNNGSLEKRTPEITPGYVQLVPKLVILNDLGRHNGHYFAEFGSFRGHLRKRSGYGSVKTEPKKFIFELRQRPHPPQS